MTTKSNLSYNNKDSFVNSFSLADYIIIHSLKPLYLTQLLSLLYFYQMGAIIFNRALPFEDEIKIKNDFLYIEDISTKYNKYKRKDLRKSTMQKIPYVFKKHSLREKFLIQLIDYCSTIKEEDIINIVLESPLFKTASLTIKKIIAFKSTIKSQKAIQALKKENAILPIFLPEKRLSH